MQPGGTQRQMGRLDLGPAIIRAAAWPIETIDRLRSPELALAADHWLDQEEIVRRDSARLSECLYQLVPTIADDALRAAVLSLRRFIRRSTNPPPVPLNELLRSSHEVPPELRHLLRRQSEALSALAEQRTALVRQYEASLADERKEVYRISRDPAFQKALYIASPRAFRALFEAESSERELPRRLDLTLYAYIMRSVGRAAPNGLWAGVAMETSATGKGPLISASWDPPIRVRFTPDLRPFCDALRAMAHRKSSQGEIPLRLNPTLFRVDSSLWRFGDWRDGIWRIFNISDHPLLSALTTVFSDAPTRLPDEIHRHFLARHVVQSRVKAKKAVSDMLKVGVLWSTLSLSRAYRDPWQALDDAVTRVPRGERPRWDACLHSLRSICRRLDRRYSFVSVEELQHHMAAAREFLNALLVRYGVPRVPADTHVLIADMRAPFRFTISSGLRAKIERALREYWKFDRYGLGEAETQVECRQEFGEFARAGSLPVIEIVHRKQLADQRVGRMSRLVLSGGKKLDWPKEMVRRSGATPSIISEPSVEAKAGTAIHRWHEELRYVFANQRHRLRIASADREELPLAPGSTLLLLDVRGNECTLRLGSQTPDPCTFYSRFNHVFREDGGRTDAFVTWYRESLRRIEVRLANLRFADLAVEARANPNAASRPRMTKRLLDGFDQNGRLLCRTRVRFDTTGRPRLCDVGRRLVIVPYLHSGISLDGLDPLSRCLSSVSRLAGRPSLMMPLAPSAPETDQWFHLPRLYINETTAISSERWTPPMIVKEELVRASGFNRYIAWRRYVRGARLPRLVYGAYGRHNTEILMGTDSALAVEHLGRALKAQGESLRIREAFPPPHESWLCDARGYHHVVELAVPWQAELAFWKAYSTELGSPPDAYVVRDGSRFSDHWAGEGHGSPTASNDVLEGIGEGLLSTQVRQDGNGGERGP